MAHRGHSVYIHKIYLGYFMSLCSTLTFITGMHVLLNGSITDDLE